MDLLTDVKQDQQFLTLSIAYLGTKFRDELENGMFSNINIVKFDGIGDLERYFQNCSLFCVPEVLILEVESDIASVKQIVTKMKSNPATRRVSIILLNFRGDRGTMIKAFRPYVSDIYFYPFNVADLKERLQFLFRFRLMGNEKQVGGLEENYPRRYKMPLSKRLFDIVVSSLLLLLSSPLLLVIALLIKLDSKGPVFYKSKRAGSGYKIFDFYKFRSMKVDADKELAKLTGLNQYGGASVFVKIKNDPRITRFGAFLRNTSIDELPQLFNVFKGDMSLVGNRPLPLYEAQQLTSDEWASRFLGPSGITGLWQVSKRGHAEMSDRERRELDNFYTERFSFWMDIKILLRTVPALFQQENV